MTDFSAIDFETANCNPSSVCSVGVVIMRNGIIAEKIYRLIRPEPEWYSYWNTQVHGLTATDTENAQVFPFVWKEIALKIAGLPLVAHTVLSTRGACERSIGLIKWIIPVTSFIALAARRAGYSEKLYLTTNCIQLLHFVALI